MQDCDLKEKKNSCGKVHNQTNSPTGDKSPTMAQWTEVLTAQESCWSYRDQESYSGWNLN